MIVAFITNVEELTLIFKSIKKKSVEIGLGGMIGKIIWNISFTFGLSGIIAVTLNFSYLLLLNWLILIILIFFYEQKARHQSSLKRKDAVILTGFLIVFLIVNLLTF